ncbi:MAG: hypothetical protein M3R10_04360 [Verrucomicrobiota bacterium]|nr:hypothetical protein [Verrucomicrobiota bacterium]
MLPSTSGKFPTDPIDLERSLNETLARLLGVEKKIVTVTKPTPQELEISASISDLEMAITQIAKREASNQGVTVQEVRLNFRQLGLRALELEVNVRAQKMVFATTIRITGRLEINEQLTASISGLNCAGEGAIGSMACAFLSPQLAKVNGQSFSLTTLAGSEISLRDVRFSAGDRVAATAVFAS